MTSEIGHGFSPDDIAAAAAKVERAADLGFGAEFDSELTQLANDALRSHAQRNSLRPSRTGDSRPMATPGANHARPLYFSDHPVFGPDNQEIDDHTFSVARDTSLRSTAAARELLLSPQVDSERTGFVPVGEAFPHRASATPQPAEISALIAKKPKPGVNLELH
jgi:hypothetical protein